MIVVAMHTLLCFSIPEKVFGKPKIYPLRYFFATLNMCIVEFFFHRDEFSSLHYFLLVAVFLIQIIILFKKNRMALIAVTCGVLVHLFVFRAVTISCFAIAYDTTITGIITDKHLFLITTILAYIAHAATIIIFNHFVPPKYLKTVEKNQDLLNYLFTVTISIVSFMIFNASFYRIDSKVTGIVVQQIVLPIMVLFSFYVSLSMTFRIINLYGYKTKAVELADQMDKESVLKDALINTSKIFISFNYTQNILLRLIINEKEPDITAFSSFSGFLEKSFNDFVHPDDKEKLQIISPAEQFKKGIINSTLEYRMRPLPQIFGGNDMYDPKEYIWHKLTIQTSQNEVSGDIIGYCIITEIQSEKEAELLLRHKAERDPLTGSYNKEAAENHISEYLHEKRCGTFFMFDLDNFKGINDTMGHTFGNKVLQEVYQKIRKLFRADDIVSRIGGDEFIIFTANNFTQDLCISKATKICESIKHTYKSKKGDAVTVSASIGISQSPEHGMTYTELFDKADIAMYESKKRSKNTFTIYNDDITHTQV